MSKNLRTQSTMESGGNNATMYDKDGIPIYGMDLELQKKLASKKDPEREAEVQEWIESMTSQKFSNPDDIQASLKDGVILCQLINAIKPGTVKKISKAKMAFMQMNNINAFLNACKKFGVPKTDLFVTVDLYEGKNIPAVIDTIFSLGSICKELDGYSGTTIGKKRSKKTKYEFTQEQLNQSKNAATLFSQGGKGCASQAGTRSISNNIVKSEDQGIRGTVSKMNEGGKGCASQAGTRSISNNIVKSKDQGTRGTVSQMNEGGHGCPSQAGTRSISNNIVKVSSNKKKEQEQKQEEQVDEEELGNDAQEQEQEVEVNVDDVEVEEEEEDEDDDEEDTSLEELEKLAAQRDAGEITEEEFSAKKREILGL